MTSLPEFTCKECGESKPADEFYKRKNTKSGYMGKCIKCVRVYQNGFYHSNKARDPDAHFEAMKTQTLMYRYRITLDRYRELLADQNGLCAVCGVSQGEEYFCVDHDHSCCPGTRSCGKCIRGLLCRPCNMGLGYLKDSPEILEEAARYLRTATPRTLD